LGWFWLAGKAGCGGTEVETLETLIGLDPLLPGSTMPRGRSTLAESNR
jgi:hypothetical protein